MAFRQTWPLGSTPKRHTIEQFQTAVFGEIHAAGNIAGPRYLRSEGMATVGNFKFLNELAEFDMLYLDHNGPPLQEYGTHGCGTKLEQSFHEPAMAYDQ
ncbi:MAG: hypothetical protein ACXW3U_10005 [Rhodoplanes sp.]